MTLYAECLYWTSNKEWYTIDYEKDCFVLTDKAPERAIKSFDMWLHPDKYKTKRRKKNKKA